MVRARAQTKTFGDVIALDGVDLGVSAGEVHGLVGPNGAGKTTLLALLLQLTLPDEGTLEVLGTAVARRLALRNGVAAPSEVPGAYLPSSDQE